MPEPVVIIGPANGPGGPVPAPAGTAAENAPAESPRPHAPAGPSRARRIIIAAARILGRAAKWLAIALVAVIRRYPRHSLAAGASILILGSIWYTQLLPGNGKHTPPANAIGGKLTGSPAGEKKATGDSASTQVPPAAESAGARVSGDKVAPVPSSVAASSPAGKANTATAANSSENTPDATTTQTETTAGLPLAAPKPSGDDDALIPAPIVAKAPKPETPPGSTPDPGTGTSEVIPAPVAPPAPARVNDVATATLLPGSSPAAATSVAPSGSGHADPSKAKADAVFDNLPPASTSTSASSLAAPLPGDDASKSAGATEAVAKAQTREGGSSNTASSPPEKREGLRGARSGQ